MRKLFLAMAAVTALSSTAALAQPYAPIPPVQIEIGAPPPPPGPAERFLLEPGHWQWNGVRYVWVGRHWIPRRAGYARFVPGHWGHGPYGKWHWVAGHWGA